MEKIEDLPIIEFDASRVTMKDKFTKTFGFLKTTAIGGLIFLLPLAVIAGLLGYVYNVVLVIYKPLSEYLPVSTASGTAILFLIAVGILVLLCFLCGLAARRAIARKFSELVERYLVMVFPKYAIYKDILAGNVGGETHMPSLVPVTIHFHDSIRVGYEAGRTEQGLVIAFLPGSPDPWMGAVVLVEPDQIRPLDVDFGETSAICERLGRNSTHLLAAVRDSNASPESTPTAIVDEQ
jgi:uncharacterized membrane protein